jgi:hypothetical protein
VKEIVEAIDSLKATLDGVSTEYTKELEEVERRYQEEKVAVTKKYEEKASKVKAAMAALNEVIGEKEATGARSRRRRRRTFAWIKELAPGAISYLNKEVVVPEFAATLIRQIDRPVTGEEVFEAYEKTQGRKLSRKDYHSIQEHLRRAVRAGKYGLTSTLMRNERYHRGRQVIYDVADRGIAPKTEEIVAVDEKQMDIAS